MPDIRFNSYGQRYLSDDNKKPKSPVITLDISASSAEAAKLKTDGQFRFFINRTYKIFTKKSKI